MSHSIYIETVEVQAGYFLMGCSDLDIHASWYERPIREIWLPTYRIQKWPISVALWRVFVTETSYEWNFWNELSRVCPTEDCPIVYVSWKDCQEFIFWLSKKLGINFALPTEAQWEKSCRGTDGQSFPWGNKFSDDQTSEDCFELYMNRRFPLERKSSLASPCGCFDMGQNIYEWCKDWFDEAYYSYGDTRNPQGPSQGETKSIRGANPCQKPSYCWQRWEGEPNIRDGDTGFRLVINTDA